MGVWAALKAYCVTLPSFVAFHIAMRIAYFFNPSSFKNKHEGALTDDWLASTRFLKTIWRKIQFQAARDVSLGSDVIDTDLYDLRSESTVKLFDYMKENRPLIVNFGSCT